MIIMENLKLQLENEGYALTDYPENAIYVLQDGTMVDGEFDCGYRGLDHNMISFAVPVKRSLDYTGFWKYVHNELGLLRVVPETGVCLAGIDQELTEEQEEYVNYMGYELERY